MYGEHYSRPWRKIRSERPCGLAYNTGRCPDDFMCLYSHEPRDFKSWRDGRGQIPCAYGPACNQFTKQKCVYSHPSSPSSPLYRNEKSKYYTNRICTSERRQRMLEGLALVQSLDKLSINGPSEASTGAVEAVQRLSISNDKFLASYNKLSDNKIAVPGFPQQFVPPTKTLSVKLDLDEHNDPKNSRGSRRTYPTYTHNLEPLVCAVQCMTQEAGNMLESTDIVANAGSLYRLFHYVSGNHISAHRFDLEWRPKGDGSGGGALLMQQWNADPDHKVSYGRGNNFASMTCHYPDETPEFLRDSFTHHRVLSYGFGSLQCVIHCEADGFYEPAGAGCGRNAIIAMEGAGRPATPPTRYQGLAQPISYHAPQRQSSTLMPPTPPMSPREIPSYIAGSRFALLDLECTEDCADDETDNGESNMLESDTLSITLNMDTRSPVSEKYVEVKTFSLATKQGLAIPPEPQLYFGRTKQLYKAGHMFGHFQASGSSGKDQVQDMTETLRQWEDNHQDNLASVHSVLVHVRKLASEMAGKGHTKLSLVCPGPDESATVPMRVFIRNDERSFLPARY